MKNLKIRNKRSNLVPISNARLKTGFQGCVVNIKTFTTLYLSKIHSGKARRLHTNTRSVSRSFRGKFWISLNFLFFASHFHYCIYVCIHCLVLKYKYRRSLAKYDHLNFIGNNNNPTLIQSSLKKIIGQHNNSTTLGEFTGKSHCFKI